MASGERPLRVLSLDGGGVRGLSIIYILQDVMRRVNLGRSKEEKLEPWEYFDMIGGTSTGGIIAVMLGCLKMSLEECERAYLELSQEIFTPRRSNHRVIGRAVDFANADGIFDAQVLENSIKKIIESHSTSSEVELLGDPEPECKVFVCAMQSSKRDTTPALLRTYKNNAVADLLSKKFKLWEACRATSAASTFFDPLVLRDGPKSLYFIDGGVALNNPVNCVLQEAQEVWGRDRRMSLISVGTGDAPIGQFHGSLKKVVQGLAKIATDTRATAEQFYSNQLGHPQLAENYFRLNVSGMGTIGLKEYEMCSEIEQATGYYLQTGETKTKLEKCVEALLETEKQGQTAQLNDANLKDIREFTRDLYQRSFKYGDMGRVPQRSRNTCEWFLKHPNFVQWQQSTEASALWVTADAGCGKSVLAKFLIGHLARGHKVIYFFFRNPYYGLNHLLCALLHQLLTLAIESCEAESSAMLLLLRDELKYKKGEQVMDEDETLWNIICNASTGAQLTSSKVFCVIDGLDECEEPSRSQFIKFFVSTFSSSDTARQPHQPPNILITSRPYSVVEEQFQPLSHIRLRLEEKTSETSKDIETMITERIQNLNPERFPRESRQYLHGELSRKAGRTFLWAKLILDELERLDLTAKKEVRKLLDTNPSELNILYASSLSTKNKEKTRRLLQILIAATRPLHLDEVNTALQIDETCGRLEDIELEPDIEGAIKRLCGSVVRITRSTVDFMHQTAREFLTQSTLEPLENSIWGSSINVVQSHCVLGAVCLWYLALETWNEMLVEFIRESSPAFQKRRKRSNKNLSGRLRVYFTIPASVNDIPKRFPAEAKRDFRFYKYAGANWAYHSNKVLEGLEGTHKTGLDPDHNFRQLDDLLSSLRETDFRAIQRRTITESDPFVFLERESFHSVTKRLLSGPRIKNYTDEQLCQAACQVLEYTKNVSTWPLLQYAIDTFGAFEQSSYKRTNENFLEIANAAARNRSISTIEYMKQKAEVVLNEAALRDGMLDAVQESDFSSVVKLVDWGAKDLDARYLIGAFEILFRGLNMSRRESQDSSRQDLSRNNQIILHLFQNQDYRNLSKQLGHICSDIFNGSHVDLDNENVEMTNIFEEFLHTLMDWPLEDYLYALFEAIRWHHSCVGYLIESRVDLFCALTKYKNLDSGDVAEPKDEFKPAVVRIPLALHELFSVACRYGSPAVYQLFDVFHPDINVNKRDIFGITPLIAAILAGDYSLCEWLLQKGADVNVCANFLHLKKGGGRKWWAEAIGLKSLPPGSDTERVFQIWHTAWKWTEMHPMIPKIWERCIWGHEDGCPLTYALQSGNLEMFALLLEYGGNPWEDYRLDLHYPRETVSVISIAARHGERFFNLALNLTRSKMADCFDISKREKCSGRTFLHIAARWGFRASVMKLSSQGPTAVNVKDVWGATPLHEVASRASRRKKTFKKLIKRHNANPGIEDNDGKTPLDLLKQEAWPDSLNSSKDANQTRDFLQNLEGEIVNMSSPRSLPPASLQEPQRKRKRSSPTRAHSTSDPSEIGTDDFWETPYQLPRRSKKTRQ